MSVKATREDRFRELAQKYGLVAEDFVKIQGGIFHMKRSGVEKVQAGAGITIEYDIIHLDIEKGSVAMRASGKDREGNALVTFASSTAANEFRKGNTTNAHYLETCEARVRSRVVLGLTGFYSAGAFGDEEMDS